MRSKSFGILSAVLLSLVLSGCQSSSDSVPQTENESIINAFNAGGQETTEVRDASETESREDGAAESEETFNVEAIQGGPYGKIILFLPEGWKFETCPVDDDNLICGMYGIHFYPADVEEGYIELSYNDAFGVCGTGLESEIADIAGRQVSIGTYDEHKYWDFISFQEDYEGIVAYTHLVDGWRPEDLDSVMEILNTLFFDSSEKEGAAYVYHAESEASELGVLFSLKNITPSGAVLVFNQYDSEAPTGELEFGDDFELEVQKNGMWESVPVVVEGEAAFNAIAYIIVPEQSTEAELNWEWLYGELPAGEYRIRKVIHDFRGTGDFDKHTVYAHFILN